jgi:hypothetical protein
VSRIIDVRLKKTPKNGIQHEQGGSMKKTTLFVGRFSAVAVLSALIFCSHPRKPFLSADGFKNPPSYSKVHTWWHWLDGNITKEGITGDLEAMKDQGIVQATILNVGLFGDRDFGIPKVVFGSDQWFEMFRWALQEAKRLGIRIGVHNCDGWSSTGGPWITPEMSMKQFVWTKTAVEGGRTVRLNLKRPFAVQNFYRDAAVVAYRTDEKTNSFRLASPEMTLNDTTDASMMADGNPVSGVEIKKGDRVTISSGAPLRFNRIAVHPRRSFMWNNADEFTCVFTVATSQDGKRYGKIKEVGVKGLNQTGIVPVPPTSARFVRITVEALGGGDAWIPVFLSEIELLRDGEKPSFSPSIPNLSEKTASIKPSREDCFYSRGEDDPNQPVPSVKDVLVLTDRMAADGTLQWEAPEGNWTVLRFGYTATGATNGPATKEGTGLECDKMDAAAVDLHFGNFPKRLIDAAGSYTGNTFAFLLVDSWECAFQNWTDDFPDEFEKRRGYSLIPFLPVLSGDRIGSSEESEAVLFDFRKTIADLIEENYYEHFSDRCRKEKLEFHAEVIYGNSNYPPLDILRTTRCVDLPMYEFWTGTDSHSLLQYTPTAGPEFNMPSCASAGYGKSVTASEAYTGMAHYSESFQNLKPFGDRAYCAGINRMILHSNVHQPSNQKPGMTLGQYGSHFNRNNGPWLFASEWLAYQSRIQYCLQQGEVSADVLYFLGDQLPQYFVHNRSNTVPPGYQVNACNFDILKNRVRPVDGKLRLNDATDYALLSLPEFPFMDLETLKLIESLVKEGAAVYGPKPEHVLSLSDAKVHQAAFVALADRLWGKIDGKTVFENAYGMGKVFWGMPIGEALKKIGLTPDFTTNREESDSFQFIHKKINGMDVYFVANQKNSTLPRECLFRAGDKVPEIFDPETGRVEKPAVFRFENGSVRVPVTFKPYQSLLFVFKPDKATENITTVLKNAKQIFPSQGGQDVQIPKVLIESGGLSGIPVESGQYDFVTQNGKTLSGRFSSPEELEIADFTGMVRFEPAYPAQGIATVKISRLKPLTDFQDPDVRYFAGNATYSIRFTVPEGFAAERDSVLLDVGDFEAAGEVKLNGNPLGKIWNPGTELNVTGLLKKENELEVSIATVCRNRFIGDFIEYGEVRSLWTSSPIGDFLNKHSPLKPSGLMGPLKLVKVNRQRVSG